MLPEIFIGDKAAEKCGCFPFITLHSDVSVWASIEDVAPENPLLLNNPVANLYIDKCGKIRSLWLNGLIRKGRLRVKACSALYVKYPLKIDNVSVSKHKRS